MVGGGWEGGAVRDLFGRWGFLGYGVWFRVGSKSMGHKFCIVR